MIIKANKQIGFIYKNNESIDKILKDGDVVFEKGFLREKTSTTLPITFGGVGKNLKDYKIYGNTYQNSTSGKNLLNVPSTYTVERTTVDYSLQPGTYIVSCESPENYRRLLFFRWKENTYNGDYIYIEPNTTSTQFTITKEVSKINFYSRNNASNSTGNTTTYINLMIRNSSISDDTYEPYTNGASPNPDYPQEIISCGDRTKNLFLASDVPASAYHTTYSKIEKNKFSLNYNQETSDSNTSYARIDFDITQFKPNTQYTISKKHNVEGVSFNKVGSLRTYINGSNGNVVTSDSLTFTTPNEITSLGVYFYLGYNNTIQGESTITFYDIQIEENSSATPYEPYGYKIPVNVRSDNLFDGNYINAYIGSTNNITLVTVNTTAKTAIIKCKPNTTYVIKKNEQSDRFGVFDYPIIADNGTTLNQLYKNDDVSECTITTNSNAQYLYVYVSTSSQSKTPLMTIVEGSTTPDKYIPYYNETTNIYLDEPLRKKDGYSDYIDFINGKVVRQLGEVILDNNNTWTFLQAYSRRTYYTDVTSLKQSSSNDEEALLFANCFKGYSVINLLQNDASPYGICRRTNQSQILIRNDNVQSINDFQTWISSNPVTVDYVLSTPVEETITLPNIPTVDGNNTLNIETEITPSQIYIKYKSNT